jgi:glycosyltransferase involved in cell wall biosynthesis
MPLAVLEALRAGIPIVASDLPGVRTIIGYSDAGVPVATPAAMRETLSLLIAEAPIRRRMGALGRQRFDAEYTVEVMGRRVDEVYGASRARVEALSPRRRGRGRPSAR